MVQPVEADVFLNAPAAARRLGLPVRALVHLLESGVLQGERVERRWRIRATELGRWSAQHRSDTPEQDRGAASLPALIAYIGADERYRYVNQGYEAWWGIPWPAVRGRHLRDVLGESTYTSIRPHVQAALTGQAVSYEHVMPTPSGGVRAVTATYIPDRDADGTVRGFFFLVRDRTDREAALASLASEQRYRDLFDNADDVLYTLDLAGNVTDFNRAGERLSGYRRDELLGTPLSRLIAPDHIGRMQAMLERKLAGEALTACEVDVITRDGRRLTVEVRSRLLIYGGKPVGIQGSARDITERREAEAARAHASRRFQALIEHSHDGVLLVGARGGVHYASAGVRNVLGYAEHELAKIDLYSLVEAEDRETVRTTMRGVLAQPGVTLHMTIRARHRDGRRRWIEGLATNLLEDPAVSAIVINIRDVTERREAEAALHTSRDQLQAILQSVADGIIVQEPNGQMLYANEAAARMIGYPSVEALLDAGLERLQQDFRLLSEDGQPFPPEAVPGRIAVRTGRIAEAVVRWQSVATGEDHWSHVRAAPVLDEHGRVRFAVTAFQDITALKRAAEERGHLLTQEQAARAAAVAAADRMRRLQDLTAALSEAVTPEQVAEVVTERGVAALGAYAGGVVLLEPAGDVLVILRATGYTPEDMARFSRYPVTADNPIAEAVRSARPVWIENVQAVAERFPRHAERARAGTGSRAIAALPLFERGKVTGAFALSFREQRTFSPKDREFIEVFAHQCAQALARARLYEAERAARAEAEASSRAKDEFLTVLSHELRTPLTPILGYTGILRRRPNLGQEQMHQALRSIERSARAQERLVSDLLDVSRIVTGKLEMTREPVALEAVVTAAMEALRPTAEEQGVALQLWLYPASLIVEGDPGRLQQVVWNLVANAIKFTPSGGSVSVHLDRHMDDARVTVSDTGAGIPPDFLPYVFDRFRQADSSSMRRHGGLGLGLAIVRSVIEMHGGSASAASAGEGKGATFTIRLPLTVQSATVPAVPEAAERRPLAGSRPLAGVHVLILEDEADTRRFLRLLLENEGVSVSEAETAAEALALLDTAAADMIVADVGLPGEDGYSFIQQLRDRDRTTPVLALTAYAALSDRERALAAGFSEYLAKPVDSADLLAVVMRMVAGPPV